MYSYKYYIYKTSTRTCGSWTGKPGKILWLKQLNVNETHSWYHNHYIRFINIPTLEMNGIGYMILHILFRPSKEKVIRMLCDKQDKGSVYYEEDSRKTNKYTNFDSIGDAKIEELYRLLNAK